MHLKISTTLYCRVESDAMLSLFVSFGKAVKCCTDNQVMIVNKTQVRKNFMTFQHIQHFRQHMTELTMLSCSYTKSEYTDRHTHIPARLFWASTDYIKPKQIDKLSAFPCRGTFLLLHNNKQNVHLVSTQIPARGWWMEERAHVKNTNGKVINQTHRRLLVYTWSGKHNR